MAKSKIVIEFKTIFSQGDILDIQVAGPNGTYTLRESFTRALSTADFSNTGLAQYSSSPSRAAQYYYKALIRDYAGVVDVTFSYNYYASTVTIEAVNNCDVLTVFTVLQHPTPTTKYDITISNEDCTSDNVAEVISAEFTGAGCVDIDLTIETSIPLAESNIVEQEPPPVQGCSIWYLYAYSTQEQFPDRIYVKYLDCTGSSQVKEVEVAPGAGIYFYAYTPVEIFLGGQDVWKVGDGAWPTTGPLGKVEIANGNLIWNGTEWVDGTVEIPPVEILTPLDNPYTVTIPRGTDYTYNGIDINNNDVSFTIPVPPVLDIDLIAVNVVNSNNQAAVTIITDLALDLQYKIDTGEWQVSNEFFVPLGATYILYIKDLYGCEVNTTFTVDDVVINVPVVSEKKYCGDLHELNVGKYLNLFGKQHTMKISFVCNAQPQAVKIFKHIQMILSTDYSIKHIDIITSRDQQRYIPGDHMAYRIREGMHSVPLKNPEDWDDMRGSWAELTIEIESINNQKVDLFSVIMHLRKSII